MTDFNPVSLSINGTRYLEWQEMQVVRSIERGPWEFEFAVQNPWQNDQKRRIKRGDSVEVKYHNEVMLTGYVDDINADYDANSHKLTIQGRSKLADLIDCSGFDKTYQQLSLAQIATQVCKPFDIKVVNQAKQDEPFASKAIAKGEDFWGFVEELARMRAVRLTDSPSGDLYLVQTLTEQSTTPLVMGGNVVSARASHSARELFSEYHVLANEDAIGFGPGSAKDLSHPAGSVGDVIKRYRPLTIPVAFSANAADCAKRADLQKRVHRGRAESITYTVRGWEQDNGSTWLPGIKVMVRDAYADINEVQTIMETRCVVTADGGASTEITVMPNYVLELLPVPDEDDATPGLKNETD